MAINAEIPEDVLILILSRLPVKSLLRFKSVSKYWYALIQKPSFISLHNIISRNDDSLLIKLDFQFSRSLFCDFPSRRRRCGFSLFGCSNGIVCFSSGSKLVLCNPATREFRLLPPPLFDARRYSCRNLGFAFDPGTNDYKVLRLVTYYDQNVEIYGMSTDVTYYDQKAEIYSMSTDSWREVDAMVPKDIGYYTKPYCLTCLDRVLYWMAFGRNTSCRKIISFNMFDELFEQIFLPGDICVNDIYISSLSVLRDSLAFVTDKVDRLGPESCFYIWVRDGNGVEYYWNKKYSIGPILGRYVAMGIRRNGELLLLRVNDRHMVSYKLDTQDIKEYHNAVDDPAVIPFRVLSFAENLVSVKRRV